MEQQLLDTRWGVSLCSLTETGRRPVLLLHADAHDHHDFDTIVGPLVDAGVPTVAIDWPGHGQSTWHADPAALTTVACSQVVNEVVDHLDLRGVVIIGNSVGGYAAGGCAIDQPERVARLVLVNCVEREVPVTAHRHRRI